MRKFLAATFLIFALCISHAEAAMPHIDFSPLPRWMNDKFYNLVFDHNRFNVAVGGAGSGKSVGLTQRDVYRMTAEPGHNYLVVRRVAESNRNSTYAAMVEWITKWNLLPFYDINDSRMEILNRANKNAMIFGGMNDARARERTKSTTFKSGPLTDVRVEEATELEPEDIDQLNLRLRGIAKQPFQMSLLFNPVSVNHHLKARFFDNKVENATILRTTYLDNRFLDPGYRQELDRLKTTDPVLYQIYALGEWGQAGDAAFPNADFIPCPYSLDEFDSYTFGMDFGYQHHHAIEGLGLKDGELWSFSELYVREKTNPQIIALAAPVLPKDEHCHADSAEPKSIQEWRDSGFNVDPVDKYPGSVAAQYAYLRAPKWHIDEAKCPGLAAEVRGAVYRKDRQGKPTEEIFSFRDDALAACRYAGEGLRDRIQIDPAIALALKMRRSR